jgi:hypothetical protein
VAAEQTAATERAARAKVDAQLAAALERIAELEGAAGSEAELLRREAVALEQRLDEARAERARLEAGDAALAEARAEADELRRRLADVEARLTEEVAARARAERHALQTPASGREQALTAEVASLTEELGRRTATQQRVQAAISAVREELASVRAQVEATRAGSSTLRAELTAAEHRRTTLEDALRARETELARAREALEEAHKAIADTHRQGSKARERLDIAERAAAELRDRLAAERRLREAAEQSARAELEPLVAELTTEVERMRETVGTLEAEVADERTRRETAERERDEARAAAAARAAAVPPAVERRRPEPAAASPQEAPAPPEPAAPPEAAASPRTGDEALDALIAGLRAQVASAREHLAEWEAEREGATAPAEPRAEEPPPPEQEPAAPALARPDDETRRRLQDIEADLRAAMPEPGAGKPAREVIASLQSAADRLRAAAEEELAREDLEPEPEEDEAPDAEAAGQARSILGPRAIGAGRERPWLRTGIERLAAVDTKRAADLLVAVLPAQALLGLKLTYALTAEGMDPVRVALDPGAARVDRGPERLDAEATLSGSIAALAPLAAGGAGWRLKDVRVEGARRGVRKLTRARRAPVTLSDLALLTPPPPPDALLAALAAAVEPAWTAGHRFGVSYLVTDPDVDGTPFEAGRWTILADDGRPLRITDNGGRQPHAATIELSPDALLPVLLGDAAPAGERAVVTGDRRAVDVLHGWFDRARGVAGG